MSTLAMPDLLFYLFATLLLLSATYLIVTKNPVHSVLALIFAFFNAAGIFILLGAEFLGLLLVMVYVGAVAVMFLFVIMTINIDFAELKVGMTRYLPAGLVVAGLLLVELALVAWLGIFNPQFKPMFALQPMGMEDNIVALGRVLFTNYWLPFQMAGLILLVAMIGAIVLTHRRRSGVKRQQPGAQVLRQHGVRLAKPRSGEGVE